MDERIERIKAELPPMQLQVLRHALGLAFDGAGRATRNHFVTGDGEDFESCTALVEKGLMARRPPSAITGGDPWFFATPLGMRVAGA